MCGTLSEKHTEFQDSTWLAALPQRKTNARLFSTLSCPRPWVSFTEQIARENIICDRICNFTVSKNRPLCCGRPLEKCALRRYNNNYWIFQILMAGTGTFGRVLLAHDRRTSEYHALKIMNIREVIRLKQVEHVQNEKNILSKIEHPFIVNLWVYRACKHSSIL